MKVSYLDLLNALQWEKKRKKILKRDGYKCTVCGSSKNLRVHHTFYYKNHIKPWEYPDKSLLTLCNDCHYEYHIKVEVEIKESPRLKKKHKNKLFKLSKPLTKKQIEGEKRRIRHKKHNAKLMYR